MENKIRRIGVLTSGGDSPGMNAAVRAVVRTAVSNGVQCIGIRRGWQGLINSDFVQLDAASVGHIISRGGTILYTARSEDFMSEKGRLKAVSTCKMLGLDGIVAIGGDGTFRGALALSRLGVPVVGVPATIDNDIGCTNYTIGFDTACNTAIECIDRLRDTMQSHERCSVVEVMGRNAGFLALYVGIAVGATAVLVPERELDFQRDVIERIRSARLAGSTHFMIVVAEGVGSAVEIGKRIHEEFGIDPYSAKVEEAQQLLAEAGYPNGEGFPELTVLYYESGSNAVVAEAVQQMWQDNLGIKVKLQGQEYAVFANLVGTNDWAVCFTGWSADYNDPMTMMSLFTANGMNQARWRYKAYEGVPDDVTLNPEQEAYDIAVNMAAVTSGEERDAYLMEAEKVLMENHIIAPVYYHTYTQVIDFTRVAGPGRTPIGQWDFQYYTVIE